MKTILTILFILTSINLHAQNKVQVEREEAVGASQRILQKKRERMSGLPMRQEHQQTQKKNKENKAKEEKIDD